MLGFILSVIISVIFAFLGDAVVRGTMPGGRWVTALIATLGAWIGGYMDAFRGVGPVFDKLNLIPALIGSLIFVIVYGFFRKSISQLKV